jgi:Fe-S cluster assembly protein SufD
LTQAFVAEVVERIEHEGAREAARAWVERRLAELGR